MRRKIVVIVVLSIFLSSYSLLVTNDSPKISKIPQITITGEKYPDIAPQELAIGSTSPGCVNLKILYITDWHGCLMPEGARGGAATYMSYFNNEGFSANPDNFLLLSGGDYCCGPAATTFTEGQAMIDVMNQMNFTASAIGNHEFDTGVQWIQKQQEWANFPLLSCNVYDKGTSNLANFTIPYSIVTRTGIKIGIIGLTTINCLTTSHPRQAIDYDFWDYETAIRAQIDDVRAAGAEVLIVVAHVSPSALKTLASSVADLGITAFLGGHSGGTTIETVSSAIVAMPNHYADQYIRVDLTIDTDTQPDQVISKSAVAIDNLNSGIESNLIIQNRVTWWQESVGANDNITYSSTDLSFADLTQLETDADLFYFNWTYNFAVKGENYRDMLSHGSITLDDFCAAFPYFSEIGTFSMTGQELMDWVIENENGVQGAAGLQYTKNYDNTFSKFQIMENKVFTDVIPAKVYYGLMADYLWWMAKVQNQSSLYPFNLTNTGIHYRTAVLKYFRSLDDLALYIGEDRYSHFNTTSTTASKPLQSSTSGFTLEMILPVIIGIYMKSKRPRK